MKRTVLVLVIAAITAASAAQAEVHVNINVGLPTPRVIVPAPLPPPPAVLFDVAPNFIAPPGLGFYVGVGTPYDIIYDSDYYYLYYGNNWHRARHHNGPWIQVPYRELPPAIRRHRIDEIRTYRDREYRVYRNDRDHYRGRHFRPDHERKEEWKYERRRNKEEWKEERQDRKRERRERD
ncbi:MAG: hypothetical protein M0T70_16790 [Geobacteraceae bacterium]|nr:hypothetical protein [Geobacteraceae bacterium]